MGVHHLLFLPRSDVPLARLLSASLCYCLSSLYPCLRAPKQDDDDDAFVDAALEQASAGSTRSTVQKLSQRDERNPRLSRGTDLLDDDDEEEIDEAEIDAMIAKAAENSPVIRTPQTREGGDVGVAGKQVVPPVKAQQEEVAGDEDMPLEGRAVGIDLVGVPPPSLSYLSLLSSLGMNPCSRGIDLSYPRCTPCISVSRICSVFPHGVDSRLRNLLHFSCPSRFQRRESDTCQGNSRVVSTGYRRRIFPDRLCFSRTF